MIRTFSPFRNLAAALIVLALAVRIVLPSGFMPSSERGFALTICTGMDTQTVWMDKSGKLHKEDPAKGKSVEHQPCAFAGAAMAGDAPADTDLYRNAARRDGGSCICDARNFGRSRSRRAAATGHRATFLHLNPRAALRPFSRLDLGNIP